MQFLNEQDKSLVLEHLAPLGRVPSWRDDKLQFAETSARRFINDQSKAEQRPRNARLSESDAYDPAYLGLGIYESLACALIQRDYHLYERLFYLLKELDAEASGTFKTCEQAAVLLSHRSFGEQLFTHIHAGSRRNLPTLSVFVNLTGTESSVLTVYPQLSEDSKAYRVGYTNHKILLATTRSQQTSEIEITDRTNIVFNASTVPHRYSYGNDLWLTLVYDQIDQGE